MTTKLKTRKAPAAPSASPSRRAMMTALAALPIATVPILASAAAIEPDPIFALVAAAELAKAKAHEAIDIYSQMHEQARAAVLAKFGDKPAQWDVEKEMLGVDAAGQRADQLNNAQWGAEKAVLCCKPLTAAGAIALLLFTAELAAGCDLDLDDVMPSFVNAARAIAGADASKINISKRLAGVLAGDLVCGAA
jgi:hypothetical protein